VDEAVEKVLTGYKDVSSVTATEDDVVIGKTIVDSSGNVINGSLNTDQFYSEGYTAGVIDGNNTSYSRGYDDGYDTGYDKGLEEATPTLQSKEVIPNLVEQTITADTGFDGLLSVLVNAIPQSILDAEYQKGFDEAFELYKPYKLELPYIQSNGTQFIKTGLFPNQNYGVEVVYQTTSANANCGLAGCDKAWGSNGFALFHLGLEYGNNKKSDLTTNDGKMHTLSLDRGVAKLDGNQIWSVSGTFTTAYEMYIFATNRAGAVNQPFVGKIYSCKVWDNGTLIRDYIPVLDWDNVPCLYDKVTRKLYYNAGTGSFIYA
jgi:hypothetical protein